MKQKTRKSVVKKVKISGGKKKKLLHRGPRQNHYNSRATGDAKREKRNDREFFEADAKNIRKALPYA